MSHQLTPDQLAHRFRLAAEELAANAERHGVCITVTLEPLQPLAMGNVRHVVDARPSRHGPKLPAWVESVPLLGSLSPTCAQSDAASHT